MRQSQSSTMKSPNRTRTKQKQTSTPTSPHNRCSTPSSKPTTPRSRSSNRSTPPTSPTKKERVATPKSPSNYSKKEARQQATTAAKLREQLASNIHETHRQIQKTNYENPKLSFISSEDESREEVKSSSDEAGAQFNALSSSFATSLSNSFSDDRSNSSSSHHHRKGRKEDRLPILGKRAKERKEIKKRSASTRYSDMTFRFLSSYNDKSINVSRVAGCEENHENNLRALHNKATKHLKDGEYTACLDIFEDILRCHVHNYEMNNHRVAAALHNIAIVQLRDGKLDEALDAIEEAVRIRRLAFGEDSPKLADSLNELGIILLSRKEFHEAIEAFNDALEISEAKFGKEDIRVGKILNNIGCIYYEYGDYSTAEKIFQETIVMQEKLSADKVLEKDKPGALTSMSTLCNAGYVYIDSAQYQKAINFLESALETQMMVLDKGNKLILSTLDNLGYANAQDGDYDKALCHYDHLLSLQTRQTGNNNIEVSETLLKIVWVHVKLYEWEEARLKLDKIKKIQLMNNVDDKKLAKTERLINEVTYQILKYSSPLEAIAVSLTSAGVRNPFTGKKLDFSFLRSLTDDLTTSIGALKKPVNSSKMSGHKLNFS